MIRRAQLGIARLSEMNHSFMMSFKSSKGFTKIEISTKTFEEFCDRFRARVVIAVDPAALAYFGPLAMSVEWVLKTYFPCCVKHLPPSEWAILMPENGRSNDIKSLEATFDQTHILCMCRFLETIGAPTTKIIDLIMFYFHWKAVMFSGDVVLQNQWAQMTGSATTSALNNLFTCLAHAAAGYLKYHRIPYFWGVLNGDDSNLEGELGDPEHYAELGVRITLDEPGTFCRCKLAVVNGRKFLWRNPTQFFRRIGWSSKLWANVSPNVRNNYALAVLKGYAHLVVGEPVLQSYVHKVIYLLNNEIGDSPIDVSHLDFDSYLARQAYLSGKNIPAVPITEDTRREFFHLFGISQEVQLWMEEQIENLTSPLGELDFGLYLQ
jgi:hypothetical protein